MAGQRQELLLLATGQLASFSIPNATQSITMQPHGLSCGPIVALNKAKSKPRAPHKQQAAAEQQQQKRLIMIDSSCWHALP